MAKRKDVDLTDGRVIGFVVREKIITEIPISGCDPIIKKRYRDASRLYHVEDAAKEFCALARKSAGQDVNDNSTFWVTRRRATAEQ